MGLRVELRTGLDGLDPAEWDALAGDDDPFVEHAFLRALETSGSVGADAGWQPIHVLVRDEDEDRLVGALPLYAKDNSWGEFIFDFAWARASHQAGVPYYPKLVGMAPFTPATGRRFLVADDADFEEVTAALLAGARAAADEVEASSIHLLFLTDAERARAVELGLRPRLSVQFHWENDGYESFDDYLSRFRSSKRKQVRKERRQVAESDLEVAVEEGPALGETEWRALKSFYRENCLRHGTYGYLTPAFWDAIRASDAHRLVVALAYRRGEPVAASINFEKGAHLYGRYWGCVEDHDFLHFELCYYRLIERAIERGLRHFEAGAQGFHKLKRGLLPTEIHSAHWIREPRIARAVAEFLPNEAMQVKREIALLTERSPFHRG
ncbi:MAG TPA: GNAT family N-acetyltransferase [Sandaracinaceae bacterium LLY-WYZ-13_1]|nr:GNAT family N-acetyltransferase [Sandaracinaceae bacterium LLY-WYZ-13_1]